MQALVGMADILMLKNTSLMATNFPACRTLGYLLGGYSPYKGTASSQADNPTPRVADACGIKASGLTTYPLLCIHVKITVSLPT